MWETLVPSKICFFLPFCSLEIGRDWGQPGITYLNSLLIFLIGIIAFWVGGPQLEALPPLRLGADQRPRVGQSDVPLALEFDP